MRIFLVLILSFLAVSVFAQSGRVITTASDSTNEAAKISAEKMYQQAFEYSKIKFAEFEQKKIPYSENLRLQTVREQKQLAALNAAQISTLKDLKSEDFYYLGMLHWIAENFDGANINLKLFLKTDDPLLEKVQTARSVLTVIAARQNKLDEAEDFLAEYLKNPVKKSERLKMENELAAAYLSAKYFPRAAAHAEESYRLTKATFQEYTSHARALAEILDTGRTVFEIYKESGDQARTDGALEDLRKTSVVVNSTGIYYFAVDNLIKYMIATNRKSAALALYKQTLGQIKNDFSDKSWQDDLTERFKRSEKHYNLLGESAPELVEINAWLPNKAKPLSALRGKVVLVDFWATWCGPCIETFPALVEMYQAHQKEGLEILGVTRYYGEANGEKADEKMELASIQSFKEKQKLPYDFAVAENNTNQIIYGAGSIPTVVIIDRKGIIRYIETGTNDGRQQEIETIIEKLLNEK